MTEHDLTHPTWGRNVQITEWTTKSCRGFCWLTPGPAVGDILIVRGKKGPIRIRLIASSWMSDVDDMYKFKGIPDSDPTGS